MVTDEQGGELEARGAAFLPRHRQQVKISREACRGNKEIVTCSTA